MNRLKSQPYGPPTPSQVRPVREGSMHEQQNKRCTKCGIEYPRTPDFFSRKKSSKDGLRSACKVCTRSANKRWNCEHPESIREATLRYRSNSPDKVRAKRARYRINNLDKERRRCARWHQENKELVRESRARRNKANPDRNRADCHRRRARKRHAKGTHTCADIQAQYQRQKGHCYWCGKRLDKTYNVDHVIPLSRGGSNWPSNLVIACRDCNNHKYNKLPHEWPESGRLL